MDIKYATLDDLKKYRPDLCDLLYDEFLNDQSLKSFNETKKEIKPQKDLEQTVEGVKKGDVIRWNYTKEEGIVIGFEKEDGISNIIVQRYNGTKILFENDPKLYTILEGDEKSNVISKREKYVAEIKERKSTGRTLIPKPLKKKKTIYDGVIYSEPTRRGSKLRIGDWIRYKLTGRIGVVKGFIRKGGLDRIVMNEKDGVQETIIDNSHAYDIIDIKTKQSPVSRNEISNSNKSQYYPDRKMLERKARVGDMIQRKADGVIGKVVDIEKLRHGIERLILELNDGSKSGVFNDTSMYYVLIDQ